MFVSNSASGGVQNEWCDERWTKINVIDVGSKNETK